METIVCPLCASMAERVVATVADYAEPCRNVVCESCSLVYINPRPSPVELKAYYERQFIQGRHQVKSVEEARERAARKGSAKKYSIEGLRDGLSSSSSVLEIGCSYGFLLHALQETTGCRVKGVEPSAISGAFAEHEFHIPVFHGSVEDYLAAPCEERFDLIIIYHVLEHLANPVETLRELRQRLAPGGRLYVAVPDVMHLQEPPESFFQVPHLVSFSPWTLSRCLEAAGWKVLSVQRKLRPPKNGMEVIAVALDDPRPRCLPEAVAVGARADEVVRSLRLAQYLYGTLRGLKQGIQWFLPKETVERLGLRAQRLVRAVRDYVR